MTPTAPVRVLGLRPGDAPPRAAVDWIADRQAYARVIVLSAVREAPGLPARLVHPPFATPAPGAAALAAAAAGHLALPGGAPSWAVEAAALALIEGAAVIVPDPALFRDLIPISSWSMNVGRRPTDGLLVQHLGIAARMPQTFREGAAAALESILEGNPAAIDRVVRARRLLAREDGPVRFRRIGKKSAGLRPFAIYLDLLPAVAAAHAAGRGPAEWLRGVDRDDATGLFSTAGAIFI